MPAKNGRHSSQQRDPLYLFSCCEAWRDKRDLHAYLELIAALDDKDASIRTLAEDLLHRASPRSQFNVPKIASWRDAE